MEELLGHCTDCRFWRWLHWPWILGGLRTTQISNPATKTICQVARVSKPVRTLGHTIDQSLQILRIPCRLLRGRYALL